MTTTRVAAIGLVGSLGDELLAQLLASSEYAEVHVAVEQSLTSTTTRFVPWVRGAPMPAVDELFLCVTSAETFVPKDSALQRLLPEEIAPAARAARAAGIRRLVLVAPLTALLQLSSITRLIADEVELELAQLGFERFLIVRPTAADRAGRGTGLRAILNWAGKAVLDIMLPASVRLLSARTAARAILLAAAQVPAGVTVLGARELNALAEPFLPS
jgi:hypothetical protein